ncbi:multiple epidermal growth factor-like domains protein 10 isoform X1 [Haliotis rubra]|uniref:multiple epidermal growth factor-like domains protein 10 isoform X1 n=1 Tax=Haliotis rubra TaxID=36100 RepID=UPI001EE54424|nr:multiple epidermal growth factor-like domains protein 10 isoform X1 [Haliotis rubra]
MDKDVQSSAVPATVIRHLLCVTSLDYAQMDAGKAGRNLTVLYVRLGIVFILISCQSGKYGSNCSKSCDSRHCETAPVSCDHVTGACVAGCREGWIGADCTQRCKPGTYGPDCTRCGYCDVTCNVGDGRCPGECLDGFTGDRCDEDVRVSPVTSGVIGGAVVLVVMLLLIGGLMKSGRLKWISSPSTGVRNTDTGGTGGIPAHVNTSGTNEQDYTELSEVTREREEKSQYDVIQNKVYENNQI